MKHKRKKVICKKCGYVYGYSVGLGFPPAAQQANITGCPSCNAMGQVGCAPDMDGTGEGIGSNNVA